MHEEEEEEEENGRGAPKNSTGGSTSGSASAFSWKLWRTHFAEWCFCCHACADFVQRQRNNVCSSSSGGGSQNQASSSLRKQEIEYVVGEHSHYCYGACAERRRRREGRSPSSSSGGGGGGGDELRGYDNEGCTAAAEEQEKRRRRRRGSCSSSGDVVDMKNQLYHQIELRRSSLAAASNATSSSPMVDWKSIQFWALTSSSKEVVHPQPFVHPSALYWKRLSHEGFQPQLYEQEAEDKGGSSSSQGKAGQRSSNGPSPSSCSSSTLASADNKEKQQQSLGQVHFSVQYEIPNKVLLVKVIEAKDLPRPPKRRRKAAGQGQQEGDQQLKDKEQDADAAAADGELTLSSNPYVRMCLLPDQKNARRTSVKRKTQCPEFDETFAFELPFREVQMRTLQLKVKDFDKYSRHFVLGHILLPLAEINLIKGVHMWRDIMPCDKEQPDLGELLVSLNYLPSAGRLNVDVIKAKQLLQTHLVGGSAPFVRVSLCLGGSNKPCKSKRTSCCKKPHPLTDPIFNETFSFHVSPAELPEASVVLAVWDSTRSVIAHRVKDDDFVGQVVLGKNAKGPDEITHWDQMVRSQRSPVAQWHTLKARDDGNNSANGGSTTNGINGSSQ